MKAFFTQVLKINGESTHSAVDQYTDQRTMADAACQAAMKECRGTGDTALVAVATQKVCKHFEITVQHKIETTVREVQP